MPSLRGLCPARWARCSRKAAPEYAVAALYILTSLGLLAQALYALWLHLVDPCDEFIYSQTCTDKLNFFFGNKQAEVVAVFVTLVLNTGMIAVWIAHQVHHRLLPMLRSCRALASRIDLRGRARDLKRGASQRVHALFQKRERGPDFERIQREFVVQRLRRSRTITSIGAPCFILMQLFIAYQSYFRKLSLETVEDPIREIYWTYFFATGSMPLLAVIVVAVTPLVFSSLCTVFYVDCSNILLASVWAWKMATSYSVAYPFHYHWLTVSRLIQVFYLGNAKLSIALNVMILMVNIANNVIRPLGASSKEWMVYRDLLVFTGTSSLIWALERSAWVEARNTVKVRSSALIQQLLSNVCDAVPQLDSNLRLAAPCPSLATLLLRGGPIATGVPFTDLLSAEDKEHFCSCLTKKDGLQAADDEKAYTGLCHVRFRVANNQLLHASVFFSCIPDVDGQQTFLLGVCEDHMGGVAPMAEMQMPPRPPQMMRSLALAEMRAQVDVPALLPEGSAMSGDDRSSTVWTSEGSLSENGEEELLVWVDAVHHDMPVLSCSHGFALLGGVRGSCRNLHEWLSTSASLRIQIMLDSRYSSAISQVTKEQVRLTPPTVTTYRCSVRLVPRDQAPALDEAVRDPIDPVCLSFRVKEVVTRKNNERKAGRELVAESCRRARARGSRVVSRCVVGEKVPSVDDLLRESKSRRQQRSRSPSPSHSSDEDKKRSARSEEKIRLRL